MKVISQVNWSYTLYENDDGSYVMSIVVPSQNAAWAVYEKEFKLTFCEKILIRIFPEMEKNCQSIFAAGEAVGLFSLRSLRPIAIERISPYRRPEIC